MEVEKLEKCFTGTGEVKGFVFKQMAESEHGYIYEVSNQSVVHYEVIKKIISPKCIDFAKHIYSETEYKEVYPNAVNFGISGWTFRDYNKAQDKLIELGKSK